MIDPTRPSDSRSGGDTKPGAEQRVSSPADGMVFVDRTTDATSPYHGHPDDLHDLFAVNSPSTDLEDPLAELRNDPNYSALIRDLEYIAKQARLLFQPAEEAPSDEVWAKIQRELQSKPSDA